MFKDILLLVCFATLAKGAAIAGVKTTETFKRSTILDSNENYILFWKFNATHITFEVHVRTRGWVGFGLSTNGKMFPADVIVGWVNDDGTSHFSDRHTTGHSPPVMDKSQDWHLLLAKENEFGTVMKFVRRINTCDDTEDEVIQEGTSRVIFAYGTSDPANENAVSYHGSTRGTKSIALLSLNVELENLPSDSRHYDFLNRNYMVPSEPTTYWCVGFKLPPIGKHHMIKYEAVVTPGNELNVHHILLYRCKVNNPDYWNGKAGICYNRQRTLPECGNIIIAWAIGGEPFYFPQDVGFSIGGPEDEVFYIMETHFDNPTRRTDMIDDSGIRITITPTLRKHEAGMLEMGHIVSYHQVIPPGQKNYVSNSYCSDQCLSKGFTQSNLTSFKIIGALQHSHLLGRAITTRHFRNGVELKPLMQDPYYDFDFQEVRLVPEERTVLPGDSFHVECTYDSMGHTKPVLGGLSTQEEMCLTFAYYYPKMGISKCVSQPVYNNFPFQYDQLYHVIETVDWTNKSVVDYFVNHIDGSMIYQHCAGEHFQEPSQPLVLPPPQNKQPFQAPPPDCS
ncbi:hypothetical protein ACF0H5_021360 [Mactra antiquata]